MKRAAKLAAIEAIRASAKTDSEKLEEIRKIMDEEDDEATAEDGDKTEDDPPADGATDEEKEAKARAAGAKPSAMVDASVAQSILALPEAKGREALAQRLAFKPGMTVAEAKADLAAAPRASRLADRVNDPNLSADGGKKLTQEQLDIEAGAALARPMTATTLPF